MMQPKTVGDANETLGTPMAVTPEPAALEAPDAALRIAKRSLTGVPRNIGTHGLDLTTQIARDAPGPKAQE
jgi:hypothetical protein